MSKTFTEEILNKQKAVKSLQPKLETIKKNLNAKMNYIDYIHVSTIFLVSNDNNFFKKLKTQKVRSYVIVYLVT